MWASEHRRHHKHVDHDEDPYDISKGFFHAHIGWLLFKLLPQPPFDNVTDLKKDRLLMWQHRYVHSLAVLVSLVLPALIGGLWDGWTGALGGFLIGGVTKIVVLQHCTFFINSACHTIGYQPYSTRCSARDSSLMALFTFGEGYHNYHHEFQHDYRNGVKRWQFDPTKWTIWILSKLGLTAELRRVTLTRPSAPLRNGNGSTRSTGFLRRHCLASRQRKFRSNKRGEARRRREHVLRSCPGVIPRHFAVSLFYDQQNDSRSSTRQLRLLAQFRRSLQERRARSETAGDRLVRLRARGVERGAVRRSRGSCARIFRRPTARPFSERSTRRRRIGPPSPTAVAFAISITTTPTFRKSRRIRAITSRRSSPWRKVWARRARRDPGGGDRV